MSELTQIKTTLIIKKIVSPILPVVDWMLSIILLPIGTIIALAARAFCNESMQPRLVWGSVPIKNNAYWSKAMLGAGFNSETFTSQFFAINSRNDWDRILNEEFQMVPLRFRVYIAYFISLFRYDIFFISFEGFFIGRTPLRRFQHWFFKLANKKVVVLPFGEDSYVYRRAISTSLLHGLLMSYPSNARRQNEIASQVDYWCKHGDVVITFIMGLDGFGRWDALIPLGIHLDLSEWVKSSRKSFMDGSNGAVNIVHAPNHRGFKGSEFVIKAVDELKEEGLKINLILLENKPNSEVRQVFSNEADILVEQLIATAYGLNGVEGLASGLPVLSNLEDENYTLPMRRWSFLNECPVVSTSPESIKDNLRKLVTSPDLRHQIGDASRAYAKKYHGLDAAAYLFTAVIDKLYGRRDDLINIYHPILGEYPNASPKVSHPLVNNRLPNQ